MNLKWTDIQDIAIELCEKYPDIEPQYVSFPNLHKWICALDGFDDVSNHSNEKILEAIQQTWIDEIN
ncbi:MAG: Fe-S cluster assembly protein IscX [Thiomargarita sp.]|nr:Fe-S cluster assembly protein IscX [Thiomargarita sp.]